MTLVLYECLKCDATEAVPASELPFDLEEVEGYNRQCQAIPYPWQPHRTCGTPMRLHGVMAKEGFDALVKAGRDPYHPRSVVDILDELESLTVERTD